MSHLDLPPTALSPGDAGAGARPEPKAAARIPKVCVLLIGNYVNDGQQSMQRFASLLATELAGRGVDVQLIVPEPYLGQLLPAAHGVGKWLGYLDKLVLFPFFLRRAIAAGRQRAAAGGKTFLVHVGDHSNSFYTRYLREVPHIVTCHDLFAIRSARGEAGIPPTSWTGRILQRAISAGLRRAQQIVCVSEATRLDLERLYPDRRRTAETIYNGLNYAYTPMAPQNAWTRLDRLLPGLRAGRGKTDGFLLHVGGNHWYKNRLGVLAIYFALCRSLQATGATSFPRLVMAGYPLNREMQTFLAENKPWSEGVIITSPADNEDLRALYSTASLLLFPSLEEGFGWPVAEAQACGCPVVTTRRAPMTEVAGEAGAYLEPDWVAPSVEGGLAPFDRAAAAVLAVFREDSAQRAERIRRGLENAARFDSARMITRYLECYERATANPAPSFK